uniref:Parvin gamma n=1 Tax=Cyanoderma ruficeps TaxID=181631 RepID=A0A8C3NYJ2_9PASS
DCFYFPLQFLIEWINRTLKEEHIVVKSLEEDLYDGLVLHHLLENLGSLKLDVDKIALTEKKQRQKLSVILEAVAKCLQLEESQLKWSVESILAKDLLSTLHLLVAIAKHFEPTLALPPNVQVETITIETTSRGLKTSNAVEYITENKENIEAQSSKCWHCQVHCFIMCFYTPCPDPFLHHDKISMLPLKLMETHGFFFSPMVFFSKCLLSMPVHTNKIQLGNWVVTSPVNYRQQMGRETGHEGGLMTQKINLAGGTMQLRFVHGPRSLLELFIKASELWFSLLPVFVLSFPQFANEIF